MTPGQAIDLLPVLIEKIQHLETTVERLAAPPVPYWLNLPDACALKGIPYGTIKTKPDLQPNGGWSDGMNGKVRLWRRETVLEWLEITDENRPGYLAMCRKRRAAVQAAAS